MFFGCQVATGFFLSCHYVSGADVAFDRVCFIQRDVNRG